MNHDAKKLRPANLERRAALKQLGKLALGAGAALASSHALAQMQHQHGHGHSHQHGSQGAQGSTRGATPPPARAMHDHPAPHPIPWEGGSCAFCDMTLRTPAGAPQGPLFRERTYAQWAFAGEARHFESIGCALGWAYAHGVVDGAGAALYLGAYDAEQPPEAADLIAAADATFVWAERLPASMMARLGAFSSHPSAAAFTALQHEQIGRHRFLDAALLQDLAPVPIANLVPLLQRQLDG